MKERHLTQICLIIVFIGIIFFILTYEEEFNNKSISEMRQELGTKGIVFGKVDFIIRYEPMVFVLQNEEKITVFYPQKIRLEKGDIVKVFAETSEYNKEIQLFAYRVEKQ
jgi:hypothetical protein